MGRRGILQGGGAGGREGGAREGGAGKPRYHGGMSWDRDYLQPTDSVEKRSTLTWILVGVSVAVFIVGFLWEGVFFRMSRTYNAAYFNWLALTPAEVVDRFRIWQVLTCAFVEANPISLLFNMLVLYWFGQLFEELHGKRKLAALFFGGALVSSLVFLVLGYLLFRNAVLFGPAGALMAVLVAAAVLWPDMPVLCIIVRIKLKWLVLILVGLDIYNTVMSLHVGALAHLASGLWGLAYWRWHQRVFDALDAWDQRREVRDRRTAAEEERRFEEEVDRVLAKVSREGMGSLTGAERKLLDRASRRKRDA